jgi:hypothetical protein
MATIFNAVIRERVRVTENGKTRTMQKSEAIVRQLTNKAMSGDLKAIKEAVVLNHSFDGAADHLAVEDPDMEKNKAIMRRLLERAQKAQSGDTIPTQIPTE